MEDTAKYCMLMLLLLPFGVLATDAAGKTHGLMLKVAGGVVATSWIVIGLIGGFENRPNVAGIFFWAWVAWPLALLVAKGWNLKLSWGSLWMSVPLMSWYHANMAIQFHHPAEGGGGGLGAGLALFLGWSYMIVPFAVLSLACLTGRQCVRIVVEMCSGGAGANDLSGRAR